MAARCKSHVDAVLVIETVDRGNAAKRVALNEKGLLRAAQSSAPPVVDRVVLTNVVDNLYDVNGGPKGTRSNLQDSSA